MTHSFILERAKVLAQSLYDESVRSPAGPIWPTFAEFFAARSQTYIAMAQAIADHDSKEGRKVVEQFKVRREALKSLDGDEYTKALYALLDDAIAASAYPGESR